MLNFGELKEKVAVLVQRSTDTDYLAKIGVWLNLSMEFLESIYDYWNELQDTYSFNTVDGRENYPMPNRFVKPLRIYDTTNKINLTIKTEEEYIDGYLASIAAATEGNSEIARIAGMSGTKTEVSASGKTLQAKSSSTSDSGSIVVRIRGYVDSAFLIEDYEDITVSATNPTTYVAGTKTFYKITHVSKSADTTGYITIADSDSTVLEYLNPKDRVAWHKILKLGLIPDGTHALKVLFKQSAIKMVDDNDYPFTECDNFLILDTWGWALNEEKESIEKALSIWNKAKDALNVILIREMGKLGPNYQHKLSSIWLASHRR